VAFAIAVSLRAPTVAAAEPDPWLGPDKALHFAISAGLAGGGYAVSALVLDRPWQRAIAGSTFSLTLGAAKELYDLSGHGDPSWKDFTWDVAGTAVGIGIALLVDAALSSGKKNGDGSHAGVAVAPMRIVF
jgi:putative lipoprotein